MKQTIVAALTLTGVALSLFAAKNDPVVMTVGERPVKLSEFSYLYNKNRTQQETPVTLDEYVEMFADYKRKVLAAEAAGLDTTAAFRADLKRYSRELAMPYLVDSLVIDSLARITYGRMHKNLELSHLLLSPEQYGDASRRRALADSLHTLLAAGTDFAAIAREYSSDDAAKENGGDLGWFTVGRLPYVIENSVFDLKPGEISPVVETQMGSHIIKVNAVRDDRGRVKVRHILKLYRGHESADSLRARHQADSLYALLKDGADFAGLARSNSDDGSAKNGGELQPLSAGMTVPQFDSMIFSLKDGEISKPFATRFGWHIVLRESCQPIGSYEKERKGIEAMMNRDERLALARNRAIERMAARAGVSPKAMTTDDVVKLLENENTDYANLLHEYHDGFLACEVNDREVWTRSGKDVEGLKAFFDKHRGDYRWDKPRFKGYILMSTSDSVANLAREYVVSHSSMSNDSLSLELRRKFGKTVRFERVLGARGANPVIDYVAFGGPRPQPMGHWVSFVPCRYRILSQPEEVADVRGEVSVDYQKELDKNWMERLRKTYRMKVNDKVLRQVKEQ